MLLMPERHQASGAASSQPVLHLALCMAGAISAGAYTAGVVDYLLEALERWELARKKWPEHELMPRHRVVIDVITGASAGGMEGGILFRQGQHEVRIIGDQQAYDPAWYKKYSRSYKAWVRLTETTSNPQLRQLFDPQDIRRKGVLSLLNSDFIDTIAEDLLKQEEEDGRKTRPSYMADDLELCLSLSNLNGIPYSIPFSGGEPGATSTNRFANAYMVYNYRDYGHFIERPDGAEPGFGRIPVNFTGKNYANAETLKQCLKATGAFPIGLRFRTVVRNRDYILSNPLLSSPSNSQDIRDDLPENFATLNVDGGMMNNEPFDVAAYLMYRRLMGEDFNPNLSFEEGVNRYTRSFRIFEKPGDITTEEGLIDNARVFSTILVVDPFPSVAGYNYHAPDGKTDLLGIIGKIYGAFRGQLLMKPEDLYRATTGAKGSSADYSRFMIAPRRKELLNKDRETGKKYFRQIDGSDAIACGSLEGFGGFIDQSFREHDYLLGRFNCQHFLQKRFGLPYNREDDKFPAEFIGYCYEGKASRARFSYVEPGTTGGQTVLPFLPDIDPFGAEPGCVPMFDYWNEETDAGERMHRGGQPYPAWPEVDGPAILEKLEREKPVLTSRISRVIAILGPRMVGTGLVAAIGIFVMRRKAGKIAGTLIQTMVDRLRKHKLVRRQ